ncbi:MAG: hypothetical protein WDM80_10345 [Limisphaerales bacterium]
MTKLTKILLVISLTASVTGGILDFGRFKINPSLTVMLPLGAVFFGMFLISFMMQKEMARFDEENAIKLEEIRHKDADDSNCRSCSNCQCRTRKHPKTGFAEASGHEKLRELRLQR